MWLPVNFMPNCPFELPGTPPSPNLAISRCARHVCVCVCVRTRVRGRHNGRMRAGVHCAVIRCLPPAWVSVHSARVRGRGRGPSGHWARVVMMDVPPARRLSKPRVASSPALRSRPPAAQPPSAAAGNRTILNKRTCGMTVCGAPGVHRAAPGCPPTLSIGPAGVHRPRRVQIGLTGRRIVALRHAVLNL